MPIDVAEVTAVLIVADTVNAVDSSRRIFGCLSVRLSLEYCYPTSESVCELQFWTMFLACTMFVFCTKFIIVVVIVIIIIIINNLQGISVVYLSQFSCSSYLQH